MAPPPEAMVCVREAAAVKVPPILRVPESKESVFAELPKWVSLETRRVPPLIWMAPVNVLAPENSRVPAPCLMRLEVP